MMSYKLIDYSYLVQMQHIEVIMTQDIFVEL